MALVGAPVPPHLLHQDDPVNEFVDMSMYDSPMPDAIDDYNFVDNAQFYDEITSPAYPNTTSRGVIANPHQTQSTWPSSTTGLHQPMIYESRIGQSPTTASPLSPETDIFALTPTSSQEQDNAAQNSSDGASGENGQDQSISPQSLTSGYVYVDTTQFTGTTPSSHNDHRVHHHWPHQHPLVAPAGFDCQDLSGTSSIASSMQGYSSEDQWSFVSSAALPMTYDQFQHSDDSRSDGLRSAGGSLPNQVPASMAGGNAPDLLSDLDLSNSYVAVLPHGQQDQFSSFPPNLHQQAWSGGQYTHYRYTQFQEPGPHQTPVQHVHSGHVAPSSDAFQQSPPLLNTQPPFAIPPPPYRAATTETSSSRVVPNIPSQRHPSSIQREFRGHRVEQTPRRNPNLVVRARDRALQPRAQAHAAVGAESSQRGGAVRGGRRKGEHLSDETRKQSHEMRIIGGCWRCGLQRDKVKLATGQEYITL